MAKILVADDERDIRELLVDILFDAGHDVIEADDGGVALEKARDEHPDLILLDIWMPVMDGFEVLRRLREDPATQAIPVVLVTALPAAKGERPGSALGVRHYVAKPFDPERVELAVAVALREAAAETNASARPSETKLWEGSTSKGRRHHNLEGEAAISTGNQQLDKILRNGIPCGSLTLVEGTPSSGKSILTQQIVYESLLTGHGVNFLTSHQTAKGVLAQMKFIGRDVSDAVQQERLQIYPIQATAVSDSSDRPEYTDHLIASLADKIQHLCDQRHVLIVDTITDLVINSRDRAILHFFSSCHRVANRGNTIIIVLDSYALDGDLRRRLHSLVDAHFDHRVETIGMKAGIVLDVTKAHGEELGLGKGIRFDIAAGVGIRIMTGGRIRA